MNTNPAHPCLCDQIFRIELSDFFTQWFNFGEVWTITLIRLVDNSPFISRWSWEYSSLRTTHVGCLMPHWVVSWHPQCIVVTLPWQLRIRHILPCSVLFFHFFNSSRTVGFMVSLSLRIHQRSLPEQTKLHMSTPTCYRCRC